MTVRVLDRLHVVGRVETQLTAIQTTFAPALLVLLLQFCQFVTFVKNVKQFYNDGVRSNEYSVWHRGGVLGSYGIFRLKNFGCPHRSGKGV